MHHSWVHSLAIGQSVQNGVHHLLIKRTRGYLRTQLGQFGFELLVDEDERSNGTTGVTMAGGDEVIDFRV